MLQSPQSKAESTHVLLVYCRIQTVICSMYITHSHTKASAVTLFSSLDAPLDVPTGLLAGTVHLCPAKLYCFVDRTLFVDRGRRTSGVATHMYMAYMDSCGTRVCQAILDSNTKLTFFCHATNLCASSCVSCMIMTEVVMGRADRNRGTGSKPSRPGGVMSGS